MTDRTDNDLVTRARRGDGAAAGHLYDRHHETIFRFVWSRVGHRELAEDLTGDVFTRMVAALPTYSDKGVPFRAWLYRIARNLVTDSYRQNGRQQTLPLEQASAAPAPRSMEIETEMTLTLNKLRTALTRIDPRQREVIELRFLADLSLQEVAAALNESVPAVKSLQHRGLRALRAALPQEINP